MKAKQMKVKELIAELQKLNVDDSIEFCDDTYLNDRKFFKFNAIIHNDTTKSYLISMHWLNRCEDVYFF